MRAGDGGGGPASTHKGLGQGRACPGSREQRGKWHEAVGAGKWQMDVDDMKDFHL